MPLPTPSSPSLNPGADRPGRRHPRVAPLGVLLLALATASTACVQRRISITSNPPGALVHLNDQEVGRTPLEVPFTFYGTYDVRLQADDRPALWTTAEAKKPWWEHPGPDLIAELLPNTTSRVTWNFDIPAADPADADVPALLRRAEAMRDQTRAGQ